MTTFNTTYKEQLQRAKEQGLNIVALSVAYEVSNIWGIDYKDFEELCDFIRFIYIRSEINDIYSICEGLRHLLTYFDLDELGKMDLDELTSLL